MNEQFFFIVKKAIRRLNNGEIKFGILGISEDELTPEPIFYKKENNLIGSFQSDYFGFYVLRIAFRGILMCINYLVAGDINLSKKLLGPSVSNYYTCAYHILSSFLALKGRIIFDNQIIWDNGGFIEEKKFVIASFSKGRWNLNHKKWGHEGKWQEIKQLNLKDYPDSLIHLFNYWFKYGIKEEITLEEYFIKSAKNEYVGTPIQIRDIPDEFLKLIRNSRHQSIYASFGSDSEVMKDIVNGDSFDDLGIDSMAKAFKFFCYAFLNENINKLIELLNFIRTHKKTRDWIKYSIFQPYFDEQQIELIEDVELRKKIEFIKNWLSEKRQKKIALSSN